MSTPSAKNILLGAGKVLFNRWDSDGNRTGFKHLGNVPKCDLKIEVDKIEKKQSMYSVTTTYLEIIKEITATADVTLEEFDPSNVAIAFLGDEGVIKQTAVTVTAESHVVNLDKVIKLDNYMVSDVKIKPLSAIAATIGAASAVGTVTSTGTISASGTYTGTAADTYYLTITEANTMTGSIEGCKYTWKKGLSGIESAEIEATGDPVLMSDGVSVDIDVAAGQSFVADDMYSIAVTPAITEYKAGRDFKTETSMLRSGLVTIPATSGIPDGSEVLVSYTAAAGNFPKISIGTKDTVEGEILFAGDPRKGPCYNAELWHVTITPNGSLPLIGDDTSSYDVTIKVMDDRENHPEEPLGRFVKLA